MVQLCSSGLADPWGSPWGKNAVGLLMQVLWIPEVFGEI